MLELILGLIVLVLIIALIIVSNSFLSLNAKYNSLLFSKQSQSVKYGQFAEHWLPFSSKFPYNPQNFRFIGKPIDGLCFEEDKIIFVEFKTNKARLNESQKKIKELVSDKKVEWFELRME